MNLRITRLALRTPPIIADLAGSWQRSLSSPWFLSSELSPVFWGEGDILMIDGSYRDPIRGYRFKGMLRSSAVDINDYGILNEYRRTSTPFRFYPWGTDRPYWEVYIPGSLYRFAKDTPYTMPAEFELLGTEIISVEESKELAIILDPEVSYTEGEAPGSWNIVATWLPMITEGTITVIVEDEGENTDSAEGPLYYGSLRFTTTNITQPPVKATFTHNLSPYQKEIEL
ncbi:MAG: hypothetical protein ABIM46_08770 [candidate division WOR-3 bacterium]